MVFVYHQSPQKLHALVRVQILLTLKKILEEGAHVYVGNEN